MKGAQEKLVLAGDIGGTKTRLAAVSAKTGPRAPLAEATYPSGQFKSLEELVSRFLAEKNIRLERASFGVAGPVIGDRATITNLPWIIEAERLKAAVGIPQVFLLNDLEAIAAAVPYLQNEDLVILHGAEAKPEGAIAVVAPGTGLGEAFLTFDGGRYHAHPSEGGHADFAPTDEQQLALLRYLQQCYDHISYERVCSGKGIPNLYAFLKDTGAAVGAPWLDQKLAAAKDPTPVIMDAALDPEIRCPLCTATLRLFVSILGAEAGNLALKLLATGGVYLGGGIPPRILPALQQPDFLQAFQRKGRLSDFLAQIPVWVITNPKAALLGAAYRGFEV